MPSWTELSNLPLGTTIQTSFWNSVFGPNGNVAYLKEYADYVSYELEKVYFADNINVRCGWPQGLITDSQDFVVEAYYNTGDLVIPRWYVAGYPTEQYITLDGPAKYLAVLNIQFYAENYNPVSGDVSLSTFRVVILDSTGGLNVQKTIVTPDARILTGNAYTEYSLPIIIDAPFQTELIVGFINQQRLDGISNINNPAYFSIKGNTSISFYKLPIYTNSPTVATSFVLGSSNLLGTSVF